MEFNKPAGIGVNIYIDEKNQTDHKLYNTIVLIQHLITVISPKSQWAKVLNHLIKKYPIDVKRMGFPDNWQTLPIWQETINVS